MFKQLAVLAAIALVGSVGAAEAQQKYAAGMLYGGGTEPGGTVTCRVWNFTTSPVTLTVRQITNNLNETTNSFDGDSCPANNVLGSTRQCAFSLKIPGKLAYGCRVFVTGSDPRISGTLEIQNSNQAILSVVPLSPMK